MKNPTMMCLLEIFLVFVIAPRLERLLLTPPRGLGFAMLPAYSRFLPVHEGGFWRIEWMRRAMRLDWMPKYC